MTCKLTTKTRRQGTAVSLCQMRYQPIRGKDIKKIKQTRKTKKFNKKYQIINGKRGIRTLGTKICTTD